MRERITAGYTSEPSPWLGRQIVAKTWLMDVQSDIADLVRDSSRSRFFPVAPQLAGVTYVACDLWLGMFWKVGKHVDRVDTAIGNVYASLPETKSARQPMDIIGVATRGNKRRALTVELGNQAAALEASAAIDAYNLTNGSTHKAPQQALTIGHISGRDEPLFEDVAALIQDSLPVSNRLEFFEVGATLLK